MWSTLKGKNLLLWEQIHSFKSLPQLRWEVDKMVGLPPLKVYPFISGKNEFLLSEELLKHFGGMANIADTDQTAGAVFMLCSQAPLSQYLGYLHICYR